MKLFYISTAALCLFCSFTWMAIGGTAILSLVGVIFALMLLSDFAELTPSRPKARELTVAEMTEDEEAEENYQMGLALNRLSISLKELGKRIIQLEAPSRQRAEEVRDFNRSLYQKHKNIKNYNPLDGWDDTE